MPVEAERAAVLGAEDPRDAVGVERRDLLGDDRPAAAAVHAHVSRAALAEPVDQVRKNSTWPPW